MVDLSEPTASIKVAPPSPAGAVLFPWPSPSCLAFADDSVLRFIDIDGTTRATLRANAPITAVAASTDALLVGTAAGEVVTLVEGALRPLGICGGSVKHVAIRGRVGVSGHWSGHLAVWDLETGALVRAIHPKHGQIFRVGISPDASTVVVGPNSPNVYLYDRVSLEKRGVLRGRVRCIYGLAWPRPDHLLVLPFGGTVYRWNPLRAEKLGNQRVHNQSAGFVAVNEPSSLVATGGIEGVACVWSADSGELRARLRGSSGTGICGLAFVDGGRLAVFLDGGTLDVFALPP
jgi:WD40 repeat protein